MSAFAEHFSSVVEWHGFGESRILAITAELSEVEAAHAFSQYEGRIITSDSLEKWGARHGFFLADDDELYNGWHGCSAFLGQPKAKPVWVWEWE